MSRDSFGDKKGQSKSTDTFRTVPISDTKACPNCGTPVTGAGAFCSNCGAKLDGGVAPKITPSSNAAYTPSRGASSTPVSTYTPEPTTKYDELGRDRGSFDTPLSTSSMQPMPPTQQPRKKGKGKVILVLILVLLAAGGGGALTWAIMSGKIVLPWMQSTETALEPLAKSDRDEDETTLGIARPSGRKDADSDEASTEPSATDDAKDKDSKGDETDTDDANAKDESTDADADADGADTENSLVGTWTGTLSENYYGGCSGAKEKPIVLTIHSVDKHNRMKLDLKVCYHNHDSKYPAIESSPDDVYLEFKDQEVLLKDRKLSLVKNVSEYGEESTVTIDVTFEGKDSASAQVDGYGRNHSQDRFVVYKD